MIRAIPSNASDNIYCTLLAQSAIHGAMAGYTGFTVGPVNSRHAYIPISVSSFLVCNQSTLISTLSIITIPNIEWVRYLDLAERYIYTSSSFTC